MSQAQNLLYRGDILSLFVILGRNVAEVKDRKHCVSYNLLIKLCVALWAGTGAQKTKRYFLDEKYNKLFFTH